MSATILFLNVVNDFERLQITLMRPRFVTESFCLMFLILQSLPKKTSVFATRLSMWFAQTKWIIFLDKQEPAALYERNK